MQSLLLELKEKTLGMEKSCLSLFIKARQLAVKFPLPRLPISGRSRLNREGKQQLLLRQRRLSQSGDPLQGRAGNKLTGTSQQRVELVQLIY